MPVVKKRNEQTETRLLLESEDPVELPPAEIDESAVTIEREEFRPFLAELIEELRDGTRADPAPMVMTDSMFVIECETRGFWVRLWHSDQSRTRIVRAHVTSCLPLIRGLRVGLPPED